MNIFQISSVLSDSISHNISSEDSNTVMNALDLSIKGGWIMIILLILLFLSIFVLIERTMVLRKVSKVDRSFMDRINDYIADGKIDSALSLCEKENSPYSRMIEKGISRLNRPMTDVLVVIENTGNIEVAKLEKGLTILATTAAGAPMIGFLGTVTGMVKAFMSMASSGANVDITALSTGIYEALVTTIGGLIVGIIAMFAYNYLSSLIKGVVNNMESKTMEFLDILNQSAK